MRAGIGFDVHPLVEGRPLILGGVAIPFAKGLAGHSDADVLTHAVIDALLGAAGLGDIGEYFPPGDPSYLNIESLKLLEKVKDLLGQRGYKVKNMDTIIVAEKPSLFPYKEKMKQNLASVLELKETDVNIKATTSERLGFTGKEEGIAAYAIVLLKEENESNEIVF